jgi:hypothetical protein
MTIDQVGSKPPPAARARAAREASKKPIPEPAARLFKILHRIEELRP